MTDKRYPTRMHEVLGVEGEEIFTIKGSEDELYLLDVLGTMNIVNNDRPVTPWEYRCAIVNGIIRRPRLTQEQEYVLKALYVAFDFKWVAKQEDGQVMAFEDKPQKHKDYFSGETQWYCGEGEEEKDYGWKVKPSSPICGLVSWSDPEPLDIVHVLWENGVEVE